MRAFLIHAIEKDNFVYGIFEYSSDCEKMVNVLLHEWNTRKTMERMRLLTENILDYQKNFTTADLNKVFPLCFDTENENDIVTFTYTIRDIYDKEEFYNLSKIYEIYSYDLGKFNFDENYENYEDDENVNDVINTFKNMKIKKNKNIKKKRIIIDDSDDE